MEDKLCEKCGGKMEANETNNSICKACEYKLRYGINNTKRYYTKRNRGYSKRK